MSIIPWRKSIRATVELPKPAPDWDAEMVAIQAIGEALCSLDTEQEQFRALTYWMWRLRSQDHPEVNRWETMQKNVAQQSAEQIAKRMGIE